jgi:hypothetical protein
MQTRQDMRHFRQTIRQLNNEQSEAFILNTTTPCPNCNVFIEKDGGCDHMTCSQCSYQFCYICSADYAAILRHDNGRHKRGCIYYAARVSDRVIPTKMTGVHADNYAHDEDSSTLASIASAKPRAISKRTTKKKPSGIAKKKSAIAKKKATIAKKKVVVTKKKAAVTKKKVVVSQANRRGTRNGLRSSTAAVRGPVTRSQTAAQRIPG